jgi:hypothetical protein
MRQPQTHASRLIPCWPERHAANSYRVSFLVTLILLIATATLRSQPEEPILEPVFGIGDREFLIGGWNLPLPNTAANDSVADRISGISQVIAWARGMGVNVFRLPEYYGYCDTIHNGAYDALVNAADTTTDIRFFLTHIPHSQEATYGLEASG